MGKAWIPPWVPSYYSPWRRVVAAPLHQRDGARPAHPRGQEEEAKECHSLEELWSEYQEGSGESGGEELR